MQKKGNKRCLVSIATTSFGEYDSYPLERLKKSGLKFNKNNTGRQLNEDELIKLASGSRGIIAGTEKYTRRALQRLKILRVISRCGSGLDSIDLKTANELGIIVKNTVNGPIAAVAELTICLMLSLLRKVCLMDAMLKKGIWKKEMGNLLSGKTVGIIGYGRIGKKVSELLHSFGCSVFYSDPAVATDTIFAKKTTLRKILQKSDLITIHVSGGKMLLDNSKLNIVKKGAYIINASRGSVLDEKALYCLLSKRCISGAALDVFRQEPYRGKLATLENVILTPHIGSYARESRIRMERDCVENLLKFL